MPSEFDLKVRAVLEEMTAPGEMLELMQVERDGINLPMFRHAPPNLPGYFEHFCRQHGDVEFLVDGDVRLSFAETWDAARALAGGLVEGHGVKPGDHIGIAARNSANWIILYMAILAAGGVAVSLNGFWQGEELVQGINDVGCKLVFADAKRAERIVGAGADHDATLLLFQHGVLPLEGLSAVTAKGGGADTPLPAIGPLDPATILFTSGSTGRSKGAISNHRAVVQGTMSFVAAFAVVAEVMRRDGTLPNIQPTALLALPLFHVTAAVAVLTVSFALGRKIVLIKKWDAEEAMRLIEAEKVTYFVGVPLMSMEIYSHPDLDNYDLSSCFSMAAGGAPRPVEHVRRIKAKMGANGFPIIGYGLTETNAVGASNQNENYIERPDSTGRATPPIVEIATFDDAGNRLPDGERGEIGIRSIANFSGYWQQPDATKAAFTRDGFFLTGDIGYLGDEGFLYIVDRKKDIIIRGGENISCQEVEDAAYAHPSLLEVSVFGVPDERYGEVPAMVYLAKPGETLEPDRLKDHLKESLAPFKLPAHIWCQNEPLPRLGTAKIDKITVAKRYRAKLQEDG